MVGSARKHSSLSFFNTLLCQAKVYYILNMQSAIFYKTFVTDTYDVLDLGSKSQRNISYLGKLINTWSDKFINIVINALGVIYKD